ncbi:hypothetical protein [Devosia sp.]|uniref:hypothetical protein n=1 Tax=Devosia sp. TaxID=1871048 RepID=UPI0032641478
MDFNAPYLGYYIRIVAIASLLLGLNDAARLLGVQLGATSPIADLGINGFAFLAIFALSRLFAAVGLWMKASWGAVLLVGATGVELALYLMGNGDVRMSAFGFALRLVLLASVVAIFVLGIRHHRAHAHD